MKTLLGLQNKLPKALLFNEANHEEMNRPIVQVLFVTFSFTPVYVILPFEIGLLWFNDECN